GSGDPAAVYTFALDWDGSGTTDQTVVGRGGTTVDHVFPAAGTFTVGLTAARNGRSATATHVIRSTAAALQADPCCAAPAPVAGGPPGHDTTAASPARTAGPPAATRTPARRGP